MSTQPQPDQRPEQQPEAMFTPEPQATSAPSTKAEIESAVARFWEIVRKSADVIVTLRQENAMISAQNQVLRRSEQDLQNRVDGLLLRITTLEEQIAAIPAADETVNEAETKKMDAELEEMRRNIDRAEDELKSARETMDVQTDELKRRTELLQQRDAEISLMQAVLAETEHKLQEAHLHLADNELIKGQLDDVKNELRAREQQLNELHDSFGDVHRHSLEREALEARLSELELAASTYDESKARIAELEEEIQDLRQQLERAMAIVNTYRTAGLRHIEDPDLKDQMTLFSAPVAPSPAEGQTIRQLMTEEELTALAARLDNVADRVAQLLGIS